MPRTVGSTRIYGHYELQVLHTGGKIFDLACPTRQRQERAAQVLERHGWKVLTMGLPGGPYWVTAAHNGHQLAFLRVDVEPFRASTEGHVLCDRDGVVTFQAYSDLHGRLVEVEINPEDVGGVRWTMDL